MTQKKIKAAVYSQVQLAEGIFSMWLGAGEMAKAAVSDSLLPYIQMTARGFCPVPSVSVRQIRKKSF